MRLFILLFIFINLIFADNGFTSESDNQLSIKFDDLSSKIIADTKTAAAKPFDMGSGSITAAAAISVTAVLYGFDDEIRSEMKRISSKDLDRAVSVGNFIGSPYLHLGAAAALYGGSVMADSYKWESRSESLLSALFIADGATLFIKEATGRERPFVSGRKDRFTPFEFASERDSFPSMHTASSFAVSAVAASWYEDLTTKFLIHIPAAFTAFSRIYSDRHWSSDVLFGALLGEFAGVTASANRELPQNKKISFYPSVLKNTLTCNIATKW